MMISYTSLEIRGAACPFLGLTCSNMRVALQAKDTPKAWSAVATAGAAGYHDRHRNSWQGLECIRDIRLPYLDTYVIEKDFRVFLCRLETAILAASCRTKGGVGQGGSAAAEGSM
jgi:hypothetical protein